jgi:hypothetical protein
MQDFKKSYRNTNWYSFSEKIRARDNYQCLKCQKTKAEVTLQVHHKLYVCGLQPWEYALSDCLTLCKGCHVEEHSLIEPRKGWTLIGIDDLGGLYGFCERNGCGQEIRYEHYIYHPDWGYKTVGSSCIEYLTEEDKILSAEIIKIYKNISKFVHNSDWEEGVSKNGNEFIVTTYKHHLIRIYGEKNRFALQVALKIQDEKWYEWKKTIPVKDKNLNQVKEMAYIVLKGTIAEDESEKNILRNIYKRLL